MKTLIAAGFIALSLAPVSVATANAQDVGAAIARGAVRGALGDDGYRERDRDRDYDGHRRDYDRSGYNDRGGYGGDCRTVTIERDDGSVRRTRRCD